VFLTRWLPDLSAKTQKALHEWIPGYLRVSNPVDNGGAPSSAWRGRKILDAIVADPNVDLVICPITGALASMSRLACANVAVTVVAPMIVAMHVDAVPLQAPDQPVNTSPEPAAAVRVIFDPFA
jgi:acyl-CoA synthetase (NDP forming)